MVQKLLAVLLVCIWGACVNGQTTLTITTTSPCVGGTGSMPTGTGVTVILTCTATTATPTTIAGAVAANGLPDATMVFKQGGTAKFTLNAATATDATGITADAAYTGTTSAAAGANGVAVTVINAPAVMTTGGTWTCEVTAGGDSNTDGNADVAAEAFTGTAVDLSTTCSGYSMAAVCSATNTISSITLTTTGTDFAAFAADSTPAVIVISKGTTVKYQLSQSTLASATTVTGALDATGTLLAGTYTVSATTATSWTIAPTTALTDADEGTDWNMIITGTDAVKGGTGAVSLTCGAETNKIAGLLVALMVTMKTFFF